MGWKTSLILIESSDNNVSDAQILKSLGIGEIESQSDSSFDECINLDDGSIGIGRYNGNIIISDFMSKRGIFTASNNIFMRK